MAEHADRNAMPNYIQCVTNVYASLTQYLKEADGNYTFPADLYRDLKRYGEISSREIILVIIVSISMTLLRIALTKVVFTVSNRWVLCFQTVTFNIDHICPQLLVQQLLYYYVAVLVYCRFRRNVNCK